MTGPAIGHRGYIDNSRGSYGYLPHATPTPAIPKTGGIPYWRKLEREGIELKEKHIRFFIKVKIVRIVKTNIVRIPLLIWQKMTVQDAFATIRVHDTCKMPAISIPIKITASKQDTIRIRTDVFSTRNIPPAKITAKLVKTDTFRLRPSLHVYSGYDDMLACLLA